jgi:hypothetical protein
MDLFCIWASVNWTLTVLQNKECLYNHLISKRCTRGVTYDPKDPRILEYLRYDENEKKWACVECGCKYRWAQLRFEKKSQDKKLFLLYLKTIWGYYFKTIFFWSESDQGNLYTGGKGKVVNLLWNRLLWRCEHFFWMAAAVDSLAQWFPTFFCLKSHWWGDYNNISLTKCHVKVGEGRRGETC